jgi:hypothetical protein
MQNKLRSVKDYKTINTGSLVHKLLRNIRKTSNQIEESAYIFDALDKCRKKFYVCHQEKNESNMTHLKNLEHIVETIEDHGGSVLVDVNACVDYEKALDVLRTGAANSAQSIYKQRAKERYMALVLLKRADKSRFLELITSLRNNKVLRNDLWPATVTDAFDMLENFQPMTRNNNNHRNSEKQQ